MPRNDIDLPLPFRITRILASEGRDQLVKLLQGNRPLSVDESYAIGKRKTLVALEAFKVILDTQKNAFRDTVLESNHNNKKDLLKSFNQGVLETIMDAITSMNPHQG